MHMFGPLFGGKMGLFDALGCCSPMGGSKETRIKRLEAMKSHLQDRIKEIDKHIKEIQKEKAE
jgi:hypothetical protein